MHLRLALSLLATTALLSSCADEAARREYLYKPAYCLAGGLANVGKEECLPQALKEKAEAVATAKLNDAAPATPAEDASVYYTPDQRLMMSYTIARTLFKPSAKLSRSSAEISLEAAHLVPPSPAPSACGADKARADVVSYVREQMTDMEINRDTADFLSQNYTDLQLTELYRVAKLEGSMADVKDDAFLMPDPKRAGRTINVKPKAGTALGGILSYTTSRVASRMVEQRKVHIGGIVKERTHIRREEAAKTDTACAEKPPVETPVELPPTPQAKE